MTKLEHDFVIIIILTAPGDYTSALGQALTFSSHHPLNVSVPIIDDDLDEGEETFTASLLLVTDNPRIIIDPSDIEIMIKDDDGMLVFE